MKVYFHNDYRHFKDDKKVKKDVVEYSKGEHTVDDATAKKLIAKKVCVEVKAGKDK